MAYLGTCLTFSLATVWQEELEDTGEVPGELIVKGPRVPAWLGCVRTVATGVVLQLVCVLRVSTLKPPSSGTKAKGWSHLEAPRKLGAIVGDRERVGRPLKPFSGLMPSGN